MSPLFFICSPAAGAGGDLDAVDATIVTMRGSLRSSWTTASAKTCATAQENENATLTCSGPSGTINGIVFASFGTPKGTCGNFSTFNCSAAASVDKIKALCIGKHSCSIPATNVFFGGDPCLDVRKSLAVQATCSVSSPYTMSVTIPVGSTASVRVPLPKGTPQNWTVTEGTATVWHNNAFVPGDPGVTGGQATATYIEFAVGSGQYTFSLVSEK